MNNQHQQFGPHPGQHPHQHMGPHMDHQHPGIHPDHPQHPGFHPGHPQHPGFHPDHSQHPGFHPDHSQHPGFHPDHPQHPGFHPGHPQYQDQLPRQSQLPGHLDYQRPSHLYPTGIHAHFGPTPMERPSNVDAMPPLRSSLLTEAKPRLATETVAPPKSTGPAKPRKPAGLKEEFGEEHVNDEPEDLQKQKVEQDFSGEYGKQVYCRRHYYSMLPLKIIFMLGGRFPFHCSVQSDGTYHYKFKIAYPFGIYFLVSTLTMLATLVLGIVNAATIALNVKIPLLKQSEKAQEQILYEDLLIKRYYIPLIFVYASLSHGCIAAIFTIKKRHYIAHYLTFWSRAVYTMHMDVSKKARGFSVKILVGFLVVVLSLTLLAVFRIGPTSIGLPTVFGDLAFRLFIPPSKDGWLFDDEQTRLKVQICGGFFLVFTFTASKSAILLFIYHCKTLQSAFAYWNGRVYASVLRGGEFAQTVEGRTTYRLLFKDHCIISMSALMDLMEGMDQCFAFTVESYFGCQIFSLFFELYFFIRTAKHGDNRMLAAYPENNQDAYFIRPRDWAPGIIMLFVSLALMLSAAKSAADVAEEAMAGLEVIRRKTMLGRKTDEELYFMLSMFSSYTAYKKLEISAGGYYYMNKDFVIGLISSVLSYFIILYQFQPVMEKSLPGYTDTETNTRLDRQKFGKFLEEIEGLPPEHYETTTSASDIWHVFRN